jgi:hypothetical protein
MEVPPLCSNGENPPKEWVLLRPDPNALRSPSGIFNLLSIHSLTGLAIPHGHRAGLKNMSFLTETIFVIHPGTSSLIKPIAQATAPDPVMLRF